MRKLWLLDERSVLGTLIRPFIYFAIFWGFLELLMNEPPNFPIKLIPSVSIGMALLTEWLMNIVVNMEISNRK